MVENEIKRKEKNLFYFKRNLEYKVRLKRRIDLAIQTLRTKEEKELVKSKYIN
ncbi:hypothetical protein [Clostridium perfringens]|uniref:Uncharacterized protein n=1 Tax=Clostridium perfringens TaxID=1502 RepID=A0A133NES1_CLOPF|nr:hypothetical protein [Clostridium perfringens]KXA14782.1 hypothetical protein HMPREF3222_00107 [Clostridium perfringens]BDA29192.1 hypothetical protein CPBEC3_23270 [Clostridium perfringens]